MNPKFKVGDTVRVKKDCIESATFPGEFCCTKCGLGWNIKMNVYNNKVYIIAIINNSANYKLEDSSSSQSILKDGGNSDTRWLFCEHWLEEANNNNVVKIKGNRMDFILTEGDIVKVKGRLDFILKETKETDEITQTNFT